MRLASIFVAECALMLALTVSWGFHVTVPPTVSCAGASLSYCYLKDSEACGVPTLTTSHRALGDSTFSILQSWPRPMQRHPTHAHLRWLRCRRICILQKTSPGTYPGARMRSSHGTVASLPAPFDNDSQAVDEDCAMVHELTDIQPRLRGRFNTS